jgi:hypothetical protein
MPMHQTPSWVSIHRSLPILEQFFEPSVTADVGLPPSFLGNDELPSEGEGLGEGQSVSLTLPEP